MPLLYTSVFASSAAGGVDTTPPTITSSNTASNPEGSVLAHALTANESVTWTIVGGADQARFEISGSTLRWASNGVKDFEAPDDADTNNTYVVTVRATDTASNTSDQTITVTVTDVADGTLMAILTSLGLTTGLKLVLDAGDSASYSSGQSWLDRSGGGFDFFLGGTSSVEATDPTFNGTPGGLSSSEFWSFDGGDNFTYDTTNETWMENHHKDAAKLTCLAWAFPITSSDIVLIGTLGANANKVGIEWVIDTNGALRIEVGDGTAPLILQQTSTHTSSDSVWNFYGLSLDEAVGAGGIVHVVNDNSSTDDSTYASPSASAATHTMQIGASGNNNARFTSGSRLAMLAIWDIALSAAQLDSIYEATRGRFGV